MPDEFTDRRLVAIYDTVNAYDEGTQPEFYLRLAKELKPSLILDLGCGTGLITCLLGRHGFAVIGVDPSMPMLDVARGRSDTDRVSWEHGTATTLGDRGAELAIMTGHVAQFFVTDTSWAEALGALHRALSPGGRLAFETRNPAGEEWRSWGSRNRKQVIHGVSGPIEMWSEVQGIDENVIEYDIHYLFANSGEEVVAASRLRFRSEAELVSSLDATGFVVDRVYGDWDRREPGPSAPELIVVAIRP